ncbi:MAG: RDD family protein [bacterium]
MGTENEEIIGTVTREDYPPLLRRFQSIAIDQFFIVFCMIVFGILLSNINEENTGVFKAILLLGLFLVYEPFCMAYGCTIGNLICGIRVRKFDDQERRINIFNSYLRFIIKFLLGIISFFTVTSNISKRAIHDMASGSIMIYAKSRNQ